MKAPLSPSKIKNGTYLRSGRNRAPGGLFLGYKALDELRILMRIASPRNQPATKSEKSF